jgi:cyclomaltodextrinase
MPVQFRHSVIYHVLIDRFAGYTGEDWHKPRFLGGNLRGIIDKFYYFQDLGISVLWLSPFYKTSAYHGYHITDFLSVEPHFGSTEDLKELIQLSHKNNIKIIADFVPNHCAKDHSFFQAALSNPHNSYTDWFSFKKWPDKYLCFLNIDSLPKLNLHNPEVQDYMVTTAKHWLAMGLDGFRIDHVVGLPHSFLHKFSDEIGKEYPASVLIGEAWLPQIPFKMLKTVHIRHKYLRWLTGLHQEQIQREYVNVLDGVLDFKFRELLIIHLAQKARRPHTASILNNLLDRHYKNYPANYFLPTFLDNHDLNRFLFECRQDQERLKMAVTLQMSTAQPAIIYYGTEIGLTQEQPLNPLQPFSDLHARKPMPWHNQNTNLLDFFRECIQKRYEKFTIT